jgi:hypothetical protein
MNRNERDHAPELRLEQLLGREVRASNGRSVGRIEEFRAEQHGETISIHEVVIGVGGLLERLGVGLKLLMGGARLNGHVARWDQIDIGDPDRPRLTCRLEDLKPL